MNTTIASTFARLDRIEGHLPIEAILEWFGEHPLTADDLAAYLVFNKAHYVRNLLHNGPDYQALVLCWRNGHRSPIHNHRGSRCGVKVLQGTATETLFERGANGLVMPVGSRLLPPGHTCASVDDDTHQVSNLQAGSADLVTLHIYSPPLHRMEVFSLETPAVRLWEDPVNVVCVDGGGI
jgi:cysteine dioxygenase